MKEKLIAIILIIIFILGITLMIQATDNTIAKDKIPQTGFYINLIVIIAILLIVIITTLVIYKHNKKKNI